MKPRMYFSIFVRSLALQAVWNFERMQNVGFAFALLPALKALYPDPVRRREAVLRHLGFFNVHPYMVGIIIGMVIRSEEEISTGTTVPPETVNTLKNALAGPLAAIGDVFFWATWRPFLALISIGIMLATMRFHADHLLLLAPVFFIAAYTLTQVAFRAVTLVMAYRGHDKIVSVIQEMKFRNMLDHVRFLGMVVLICVMGFYFLSFSRSMYDGTWFLSVFMGAIFIGSTRLPPSVVFYGVTAAGVLMYMIRGYG